MDSTQARCSLAELVGTIQNLNLQVSAQVWNAALHPQVASPVTLALASWEQKVLLADKFNGDHGPFQGFLN